MADPCTPSTEHVRAVYAAQHGAILSDEHGREFDRWLEQHDDAVSVKLARLVSEFVIADGDDCWFDHHGGCQAHGYLGLQPGELCPHAEAKQWLATRAE